MNVRRLLAAAAGVALLAPQTAEAAPPALTITGTRHSSAVITLTETVTYDVSKARADYLGGDYAGFAIGRDFATLWTPEHTAFAGRPLMAGHSVTKGVLKPGRYRVYLFAEEGQRVTVTVPWSGADMTVETDAPVDAAVQLDRAWVTPAAPASVAIPQDAARRANLDAAAWFEAPAAPEFELRLCLTGTAAACDKKGGWTMSMPGRGSALNGFALSHSLYPTTTPTKGRYVRGEVTGTASGVLTVVTLRFYR